jgi:hypothetical protein
MNMEATTWKRERNSGTGRANNPPLVVVALWFLFSHCGF